MRWTAALLIIATTACDSGNGLVTDDLGRAGPDARPAEVGPPTELGQPETGTGLEAGSGGCQKDSDCSGATPYCAPGGTCVACEEGVAQHACPSGLACCSGTCLDTQADSANCGGCGKPCATPNAVASCSNGSCTIKSCKAGYLDCDQKPDNGCEEQGTSCACTPKATEACYSGPAATENVGPCKGGQRTCNDTGTAWGPCQGEVTPQPDACDNNIDDNCDGVLNNGFPSAPACGCQPKSVQSCYGGPAGTEGKGTCKAGQQTCSDDGQTWGPCEGEVLPLPQDSCLNLDDEDCDGIVNNGFAAGAPGCACTPGTTQPCYTGPAGTIGIGTCKGGQQTCDATGAFWELCQGEVKPSLDLCNNNLDEDCDGAADNPPDEDGDGWNVCQGDCCDFKGPCGNPELVNPGAFEVLGNLVDDDCDGKVDNSGGICDVGLASNSSTPMDYARAIDLCQTTVENPASPADKKWGVISAQLLLADGTGVPAANSRSIRPGFGNVIVPKQGSSLAVLSTGHAADLTDTNPGYAGFQFEEGQDMGTSSAFPADWLAANGGKLPNAPGCPAIKGGTAAFNPVMLKLRIRVPTNAQSFSLNTYFFSAEYPEWTCSPYNDFFVALLGSGFNGTPSNPADKNLAFYDPPPAGAPYYPVGVNLATGNTGLFRQCKNGEIGCAYSSVGNINTCISTAELAGTGFEVTPAWGGLDYGYCHKSDLTGGGTGWLTTRGNIVPGEVIEVRLAIWDTSDPWWDSVVLLDNWLWSLTPSTPGTD